MTFCQTSCVHARNNSSLYNFHWLRSQWPRLTLWPTPWSQLTLWPTIDSACNQVLARPTVESPPLIHSMAETRSSPRGGREKEERREMTRCSMKCRRRVFRMTLTRPITESQLGLWSRSSLMDSYEPILSIKRRVSPHQTDIETLSKFIKMLMLSN